MEHTRFAVDDWDEDGYPVQASCIGVTAMHRGELVAIWIDVLDYQGRQITDRDFRRECELMVIEKAHHEMMLFDERSVG